MLKKTCVMIVLFVCLSVLPVAHGAGHRLFDRSVYLPVVLDGHSPPEAPAVPETPLPKTTPIPTTSPDQSPTPLPDQSPTPRPVKTATATTVPTATATVIPTETPPSESPDETATPSPSPTETPVATSTPSPTPVPNEGENFVCDVPGDDVEICAWVSDSEPTQYSTVTVYGRLSIGGEPQTGRQMVSTWHFKTTSTACEGEMTETNQDGIAWCERSIGRASTDHTVEIEVDIDGYTVRTWFTPREQVEN